MNKATILAIMTLAVIAGLAVLVSRAMRDAQARPSVQRQLSQARLAQFAEAIKHYRDVYHVWPDSTAPILRAAKLPQTSTVVRGAGMYRYRKPPLHAPPDVLVMWSDRPHDAVAVGESWGGEGETAKQAIPAIAYALTTALEVVALSPDEWATRKPTDATGSVTPEKTPENTPKP